ncbi:cytochrome P450 [Nocardia otitidiscaviarum]|nr:cytochrome P450 [Nocardia otitidiscaviarum]MBF6484524.1 cytochrome P450 [Nocardia otitidiscaviarum]
MGVSLVTTHHAVGRAAEPFPLYSAAFAADPKTAYSELRRRYGDIAPVELAPGVPASLVLGYRTAVAILHDPQRFPADPRTWQRGVPADCPVLPVLEWRPTALRNDGVAHTRYRQASVDGLGAVDLYDLDATVERIAVPLIADFCAAGAADLIGQYAAPLAFGVMNALLGCPPEIGSRVGEATVLLFDGTDTERGNIMLSEAVRDLIVTKRERPGDDITSRLVRHPAGFDDVELLHQVAILYGAGIEPLQNLISNALLLILSDQRFAGDVLGGSLSTRDALDEVLFTDPPMANFCVTYPRQPMLVGATWLPAHQPVVISMAACNNDPEVVADGGRVGNRSHLAWGAGPHACPAQPVAYLIAQNAVDQLLDALPDMRPAVPVADLEWRPGPFHRALAALPVVFPATPPWH